MSAVSVREERRKSPRVTALHLVSYTLFDEHGNPDDEGMARTLDLSEGGMLLEVMRPLSEGGSLQIKMVSGDHIVRAQAQVVYCQRSSADRWRVGMRFTEITQGDLGTIALEVGQHCREDTGGHA